MLEVLRLQKPFPKQFMRVLDKKEYVFNSMLDSSQMRDGGESEKNVGDNHLRH